MLLILWDLMNQAIFFIATKINKWCLASVLISIVIALVMFRVMVEHAGDGGAKEVTEWALKSTEKRLVEKIEKRAGTPRTEQK